MLRPLFEKFGALTRCEIKKRFAFVGYRPQHTLQADFIFEFAHAAPAAVRSIPAVHFCPLCCRFVKDEDAVRARLEMKDYQTHGTKLTLVWRIQHSLSAATA